MVPSEIFDFFIDDMAKPALQLNCGETPHVRLYRSTTCVAFPLHVPHALAGDSLSHAPLACVHSFIHPHTRPVPACTPAPMPTFTLTPAPTFTRTSKLLLTSTPLLPTLPTPSFTFTLKHYSPRSSLTFLYSRLLHIQLTRLSNSSLTSRYSPAYTHARVYTHACTYACVHIHVHAHVFALVHVHACAYARPCPYLRLCSRPSSRSCPCILLTKAPAFFLSHPDSAFTPRTPPLSLNPCSRLCLLASAFVPKSLRFVLFIL
jgi:hypothetical protein